MAVLGLAVSFAMTPVQTVMAAETYKKAVTYASDAWVINFWNTESDHMEEELAAIAADGFNAIVLAIPWREFQPSMEPIWYNTYAFDKLDRVMEAANRQGLRVDFRVGYTWDYYGKEESKNRFRQLLYGGKTRNAWISYAQKLYETGSAYENFDGGFITWEDFWNYLEDLNGFGEAERIEEARKIGYQDYLEAHYSLEEISTYYKGETVQSYSEIPLPKRESPAFFLMYAFYDDFLNQLLCDTQEVFPDLSMEVRLDVDPVNGRGGGKIGASHHSTFPCGNASYTATMYSVSMGQKNAGEKISAQTALHTMDRILGEVKVQNGGKPIYIDQLLYTDATEAFSHNAQIYDEEQGAYLLSLPPILRTYTSGYAVWSYYNYLNNPVYNSQFALGSRGWETDNAWVEERSGSKQMRLGSYGEISQEIGHRITDKTEKENFVRFTAESDAPVTVTVCLGRLKKEVTVQGSGQYELNFGRLDYQDIAFSSNGEVYLDNIAVYNFVQDGKLHDVDGNELSCMEPLRTLNQMMN